RQLRLLRAHALLVARWRRLVAALGRGPVRRHDAYTALRPRAGRPRLLRQPDPPCRHLRGQRDDDRGVTRRRARALRRHLPQRPGGRRKALGRSGEGDGRQHEQRRGDGVRLGRQPGRPGDAVERRQQGGAPDTTPPQLFAHDALTAIAVAGREVPDIELGTSVIPSYPRHPMVLAQQALSTQAATGGRLVLGIGLSHQVVIEGMFGYSFEKPARHMREYLAILLPLVREGKVAFTGETLSANGAITANGAKPFPVLLAALGPVMLRLAGAQADGTVTWMTGPATLESHIVPSINAAADAAGRGAPRVAVGLPVCVTDDVAAARGRTARAFVVYGT